MKLLKQLYSITATSRREKGMQAFIIERLKAMGIDYYVDRFGNISAVRGQSENYPCIVSHIDEVHQKKPNDYEIVRNGNMLYGLSPSEHRFVGIGADDKNGIWVCLKCLETFQNIKCVFFASEECGCLGSMEFDMTFFNNCRFVIECDRKGNSDCIVAINRMPLCSQEFIKAVKPEGVGYVLANGFTTDVYTLKMRGLDISCLNLSCGYYNPHTDEEMTNFLDLNWCLRFVKQIIRRCKKTYPHEDIVAKRFEKRTAKKKRRTVKSPQSVQQVYDLNETPSAVVPQDNASNNRSFRQFGEENDFFADYHDKLFLDYA